MTFKGKDFLTLADYDRESINNLLDLALKLKKDSKNGILTPLLHNKTLIMIFAKPSLRTRVSFETGIQQLGGNAVVLKQDEINLGVRETVADTARVLERYADGIMIRTFSHKEVEELASYSKVPVINALTDLCHPCQVLADLLTIQEKFGRLKNLKLTYVGDGNNMANSLLIGCSLMGIDVSVASPMGYEPDRDYIWKGKDFSIESGSKILVTDNINDAIQGANIVYTDVWASMGQEKEAKARQKIFSGYQVNEKLLKKASEDVIVMHCLPAHRGEEITEDVLERFADVIFDQAENRLHAQKAVMASIMQ